ncbi:hypothetical protein J8M21_23950 [Pseudoalteromonas luteoviolacea]|uniref:MaoC/PaaZ C-terminal domain-containing protein n=1 Tax=Pseudoalteromonas luteoviolacea TaxID=43657 RepID=UPI001B3A0E70|nr:MaoC/PaaZ C-terminal domain-containing protein [Pseudoalteromonas luteoviolacea]MBQ4880260.1 hypothetical protein [Pseudoalteromonas luteoviolacea]MBQ4909321.1 hypothetical protein [Pseudoalteromonas luteoviolacea]
MKLENVVFEDIEIGQSAIRIRQVKSSDIQGLGIQPDAESLDNVAFQGTVIQGAWTVAQITAVIGSQLPGPGAVYLSQDLKFVLPVVVGDVITTKVTVIDKDLQHGLLIIDCQCSNQRKEEVVFGIVKVRAPTEDACIEIKSAKQKVLNCAY